MWVKISFIIYQTVIAFLFLMSFRVFSFKLLKVYSAKNNKKSDLDCILIYGAGQAGREILGVLQQNSNNHIVGFVDDNKDIQGRSQNNLNIYNQLTCKEMTSDKNDSDSWFNLTPLFAYYLMFFILFYWI